MSYSSTTKQKKQTHQSKMFSSNSSELPQKSLVIKEDDKFFSKVVSKESSMANPSFKVYYGGLTRSVPFMWESQPGTPKNTLSEDTLPPLTPPPSYYSNLYKKPAKKNSRSNLLHTLFPKMGQKKTHEPSSPSSSLFSSPSDSSMLVPVQYSTKCRAIRSRFLSPSSSFDSRADDEEEGVGTSPTSTLCFSFGRATSAGGNRGCHRFE